MKAQAVKVAQKSARKEPPIAYVQPAVMPAQGREYLARGGSCACGGGCPRCRETRTPATGLPVSEPGDRYEREADHVAEHVMRMPQPSELGATDSRRAVPPAAPQPAPAAGEGSGSSGGQPLDARTRAFFEPRFAFDLSQVRVREDPGAASALRARAYTIGADITFGQGEYAPHTASGRALLAHELTHVVQQTDGARSARRVAAARTPGVMLQRAFDDHCGAVAGIPADQCTGTIDVRATTISLEALAVSHLFIVFTDHAGHATVFRGGPGHAPAGGYGNIQTTCGPYDETSRDWDPSAPSVRVYEGPEACHKAQCFHDQLDFIGNADVPYAPTGPNSNSVVAHLLRSCGLPVRKPTVTAPGFNMDFNGPGGSVREAPDSADRRQRLSVGLGGRLGDLGGLGVSASYSIDAATAFNQTLRFPFRVGAEYASGGSGVLGSASIGAEAPFLNVPIPGLRIPTTIGASAGILGGGAPSALVPGRVDPLLGFLVRPLTDFGFDIGRARVDVSYQLEWLRNLQTNRDLVNHIFAIEVGATF